MGRASWGLAGMRVVAEALMAQMGWRQLRQALKVGSVAGFAVLGVFVLSALWYVLLVW